MPDARHPRPYPRGPKHPKLLMTPAWKRRVLARLAENAKSQTPPRTEAELARMVGADKGGLHDALHTEQVTYKYARQIGELLSIGDAMVENPEISEDEWTDAVRRAKAWSRERQRLALNILRSMDVDDT